MSLAANFLSGAWVRIGSMAPLPATVLSSSDLEVTIPEYAPAGANLDVIVTNPNLKQPSVIAEPERPAGGWNHDLADAGLSAEAAVRDGFERRFGARFTTSIRNRWSTSSQRLLSTTRSCSMPTGRNSMASVMVLPIGATQP